jgi:hypothetical protein
VAGGSVSGPCARCAAMAAVVAAGRPVASACAGCPVHAAALARVRPGLALALLRRGAAGRAPFLSVRRVAALARVAAPLFAVAAPVVRQPRLL